MDFAKNVIQVICNICLQKEEAVVEFTEHELQVYKRNRKGPKKAVLTSERWEKHKEKVQPSEVHFLTLKLIYIKDCPKLFDFIAKCKSVKRLCMYEIEDNTVGNQQIIQGLSHVLIMVKQFTKVQVFTLRETYIGKSGSGLFNALSCNHDIRVVDLYGSVLTGGGDQIAASLSEFPKLGFLNLGSTSLTRDEVQKVMAVLPKSCPQLLGLLLRKLDLTSTPLAEAAPKLPNLKLLSIQESTVGSVEVQKLIQNISSDIEVLSINDLKGKQAVLNGLAVSTFVKKWTNVKYIRVSEGQVAAQDKVEVALVRNGGRLLVGGQGHEYWKDYTGQGKRIADQCLKDYNSS